MTDQTRRDIELIWQALALVTQAANKGPTSIEVEYREWRQYSIAYAIYSAVPAGA